MIYPTLVRCLNRYSFIPLALVFSLALCGNALAERESDKLKSGQTLAEYFSPHDRNSKTQVDHSVFGVFLTRYVVAGKNGINLVRWSGVSKSDATSLNGYIDQLQGIDPMELSRPEQYAFWINMYNAVTVRTVLNHFPVASIRDIDTSPGWFADGPWGEKLVSVAGMKLSLDDIEHKILRPIWQDSRIHYAVNCASIGCPNLAREPFSGNKIEAQLERAASNFINHPRGLRIDGKRLVASRIWYWYDDDFGSEADLYAHWLRYLVRGRVRDAVARGAGIARYEYDWKLNGK